MRNIKSIAMLVFLFPFFACQSHSQEKWIPGTEITTYNGGGMVPESQTVIINDSVGRYIHWLQRKKDTFYFKMSQAELKSLAEQLNTSHFNNMVSGETGGIAYDKPTTSIELKSKGKTHEVNVGATTAIKKGDPSLFHGLYTYIVELAQKKTGQMD